MDDDLKYLRRFVEESSDEAFRALVERHSGMTLGVARRVAGENLAEDVVQAVFLILAKKAARLSSGVVLAGWLYRTARFVALEATRNERRRQLKIEEAAKMIDPEKAEDTWREVAPVLDQALDRLRGGERDAVVLRFLEGRSFAEVGASLGITEAAAKMRVGRAVEKLRASLQREGVTTSGGSLAAALIEHGAAEAPAGLVQSLSAAAAQGICGETPLELLAKGALKAMAISKTKMAVLVILPLALLCGGIVYQTLPRPVARTFEPMAGDWEGKMQADTDGIPADSGSAVAMRVRTRDNGRACDIELHIDSGDGTPALVMRFSHEIDETGRSITTKDDPRVGLVNGPGKVIEGKEGDGRWSAGFRAKQVNGSEDSQCVWRIEGQELTILRQDTMRMPNGKSKRGSTLKLRRRAEPPKNG